MNTTREFHALPLSAPLALALVTGKLKQYETTYGIAHRGYTIIHAGHESTPDRGMLQTDFGIETPENIPLNAIIGYAYLREISRPKIGDPYAWTWYGAVELPRPWPYSRFNPSRSGVFTVPEMRITADQHKRLEAVIAKTAKEYGLDAKAFRQRIKQWLPRFAKANTFPNPLEHIYDMTRSQAAIVENKLPSFAKQMAYEANVTEIDMQKFNAVIASDYAIRHK